MKLETLYSTIRYQFRIDYEISKTPKAIPEMKS